MSWMTPRERIFSQGGPFIAKRAGGAGDITLVDGTIYTAAELADAGLTPRNIQMMYQAHHLDMAPEAEEQELHELQPVTEAEAAIIVLIEPDCWLVTSPDNEPERFETVEAAEARQAELRAAASQNTQGGQQPSTGDQMPPTSENTPDGPEKGTGGEDQPDAGAGAAAAGEAGAAPAQGEAETAPADDPTIIAYRHFGFGAYYAINAAGTKLGDKIGKATAEGFAASANVPLLGQAEPVPVKE